jgi:hypothetical protein
MCFVCFWIEPAHTVSSRNLSFGGRDDAWCRLWNQDGAPPPLMTLVSAAVAPGRLQGGCDHQNIFSFFYLRVTAAAQSDTLDTHPQHNPPVRTLHRSGSTGW